MVSTIEITEPQEFEMIETAIPGAINDYPADNETESLTDLSTVYDGINEFEGTMVTLPSEKELTNTHEAVGETTNILTEREETAEITTELITLPLEEEVLEEVTSAPIISEPVEVSRNSYANVQLIVYCAIFAVIIVISLIGVKIIPQIIKKRNMINLEDTSSARYRDKIRLKEENGNSTSAKVKKKKEHKVIRKDVVASMPYKKILKHDVMLIDNNMYSKAYTFDDINFNLADEDEQYDYLDRYINFLNVLDDTVDAQICVWNSRLNIDDFERSVLIDQTNEKFSEYLYEYNTKVLKDSISKGQNAIKKKMCVTLTIKSSDEESAYQRFKSLDIATVDTFNQIGSARMRVMTSQERVQMIAEYFHGSDVQLPVFDENDYKNNEDMIYCSPDYFEFKSNYYLYNDKYAKAFFIKTFPNIATSNILRDLIASNLEINVAINASCYSPEKARKELQKHMLDIDTDMSKRSQRAASKGNFNITIPESVKSQREALGKVFEKINEQDQKLFNCNIVILTKANDINELNQMQGIIDGILKRNGCALGQLVFQQEDGMLDGLPCGYRRKLDIVRSMPSESVGIFIPFNVSEMQMRNSVYYGLNKISNNIVTFDRVRGFKNPSGFILGCPGSGKSFTAKREVLDVIMRQPNADVLIIDPEREYQNIVGTFEGDTVVFGGNSKNYINPFDINLDMIDVNDEDNEFGDEISAKCQLILSFISCMDETRNLDAYERGWLDKCIRHCYSKVLETGNSKDIPTLETLLEVMKENNEYIDQSVKNRLIVTVDMYVSGSSNYFNHETNVDNNNRIVSYDIKNLNGILKTQGMLLILDYIWNRLCANRDKGKLTYIYCDEIYLLFQDTYCLSYLRMLWKRARKYGGVLTGITQNVEDLLHDDMSRSMLSNSEFLILLNQNPIDAQKLKGLLNFTNNEMKYIIDVPAGHGVIVLGSGGKTKIPIYDEFPKDTKLYKQISTNFSEKIKLN